MDDRLQCAGHQLEVALNRYLEASITTQASPSGQITNVPRAQTLALVEYLPELTGFERKVQRARATIGIARNNSTVVVPIHRLSPELIARIFYHVVSSEICMLKHDGKGQLPRRSINLSHVCTHWRQIAITSPNLWSHIDVSPSILKNERSLSRTQTFLLRTGQLSLDLHIEYASEDDGGDGSSLNDFIAPLVPRTQGITCRVHPPLLVSEHRFSQSALSCFLNENIIPGKLTMLDLTVNRSSYTFFIQANEHKPSFDSLSLNVSMHRLEELLLPITVLRVSALYPQWTSKAYHGLIELRLHTHDTFLEIAESELVAILAHSPQLRVLELGIQVVPADTLPKPIALHKLEVLITHIPSYWRLGRFLRLLDTNSSPLFMSVDSPYPEDKFNNNLVHFFSRSNVTKLCTAHFSRFYKSLQLVKLAHTIKKLAMSPPPIDPGALGEPGLPIQVRLDTLYLLGNMSLDINQLRGVVDWSGIQKLVIWGDVYRATSDGRPIVSMEFLRKELSDLGVDLEILSADAPSPMDSFLL
ncbi:hypothetical protein ACGC1H_003806 [Rhizoctonia solani]